MTPRREGVNWTAIALAGIALLGSVVTTWQVQQTNHQVQETKEVSVKTHEAVNSRMDKAEAAFKAELQRSLDKLAEVQAKLDSATAAALDRAQGKDGKK